MKKILFIFIALLIVSGAKAQTYEQNQNLIDSQTAKLEKRLSEVKDRIFYLKVTAPEQLKKTKSPVEVQRLKKEIFFAKEDTVRLFSEKSSLEKAIADLKETALTGTEYRTKADVVSNIPEQMNSREYKKRSRSQVYKMSEGSSSINAPQKFRGVVINEKKGQGETAKFYISRVDIKNVPGVSITLNPGEKKDWFLPAGTYEVSMVCGSASASSIFNVDPRVLNWFNGEKVYWGVKKNLYDW